MEVKMNLDSLRDAEIIQRLKMQDSAEEYLKRLVREDVARQAHMNTDLDKAEKSFDATLRLLKQVAKK